LRANIANLCYTARMFARFSNSFSNGGFNGRPGSAAGRRNNE